MLGSRAEPLRSRAKSYSPYSQGSFGSSDQPPGPAFFVYDDEDDFAFFCNGNTV